METTIYTVARRAGVSIATVSRVLNKSARVKEETRLKVQEAIKALGYRPSAAARGLAGSATATIALLFPRISGPYFSDLILGMEDEACRHGYHLLIYGVYDQGKSDRLLEFLPSRVDGMIVATRCVEADYIAAIHRDRIPLVLLGPELRGIDVGCIRTDNLTGACQAVSHLLEHGYRRIAYIGGPRDERRGSERQTGYRRALQEGGLAWPPQLVVQGDFSESGGHRAMETLLCLPDPPDAVFAANDQMATGALAAACERGLRVPEDIALVGFDDIQAAAYLQPPLTTVHQSIYEQGVLAVQALIRRIEEPESRTETIVLPPSLVIRRSCGCDGDG